MRSVIALHIPSLASSVGPIEIISGQLLGTMTSHSVARDVISYKNAKKCVSVKLCCAEILASHVVSPKRLFKKKINDNNVFTGTEMEIESKLNYNNSDDET